MRFSRRRESTLRLTSPPKPLPSRSPKQQAALDAAVARARLGNTGDACDAHAAHARENLWPDETLAWAQLADHLGDAKAFSVVRALGALTSLSLIHI